jgi:hypothetical protein
MTIMRMLIKQRRLVSGFLLGFTALQVDDNVYPPSLDGPHSRKG